MDEIKKIKKKEIIMSCLLVVLILLVIFILLLVISNNESNNIQEVPNQAYQIVNYLDVTPVDTTSYANDTIYDTIDLKEITFKNLSADLTRDFLEKQSSDLKRITVSKEELSEYIFQNNITDCNKAISLSETFLSEIDNDILSVLYIIEEDIEYIGKNNYINSLLVNIKTNTIVSNDQFLSGYNITKKEICAKIFDIIINEYDLSATNITKEEAISNKDEYISKLVTNFDYNIYPYINDENIYVKYSKNYYANLLFGIELKEMRYSTLKV